jgi:hypothetical protein
MACGAFVYILFACFQAGTGRTPASPPETKFAVEIPGHWPDYLRIPPNGVTHWCYTPGLRKTPGADPDRLPGALKLEFKVEDGVVVIDAAVVFGRFDFDTLPNVSKMPSENVGTYRAGLYESATLFELQHFGLEPLTLRIVPPRVPVSVRPQTMSKSPSVRIEIVGEDLELGFYEVSLHNMSARGVTAARVAMREDRDASCAPVGDGSKTVIATGGTHQLRFGIPHWGKMVNGRFVGNPPPPFMVLEAAFFDDGSYEGDTQAVAEMTAERLASKIQRQRIDRLVAEVLADEQSGDDSKIERIRSEVARLSEAPDPQVVASVREQFPGLACEGVAWIEMSVGRGLHIEKAAVTAGLQDFEQRRSFPRPATLRQWWSNWRQP